MHWSGQNLPISSLLNFLLAALEKTKMASTTCWLHGKAGNDVSVRSCMEKKIKWQPKEGRKMGKIVKTLKEGKTDVKKLAIASQNSEEL